jgi:4-hydroxybenzoate polyprenyltransferase
MTEQKPEKSQHLYYFSLRWGTYCVLATVTFFAKIIPGARLFAILAILIYFIYMMADTFKISSQLGDKGIKKAFALNSQDFMYFLLALAYGLIL